MTARELAFELLFKAEASKQYSNIALDNALQKSDLSTADKNLTSALFYGVTERRLTLDYQINSLSSRPLKDIDTKALIAIRIGLYQLIYLTRIPHHAAINESVDLVPRKSSGFVNALLRSFLRRGELALPEKENTVEYLSVKYSVGVSLVKKFISIYGIEETENLLSAINDTPDTTIRVNTLITDRKTMLKNIPDAVPTSNAPNGILTRGSVRELYGFEDGLFFVQDEASQICIEALSAQENELIMDICACPGSKSFGAAIDMQNRGQILAFDLHENKLSLIKKSAERLKISIISTSAQDGRKPLSELFSKADRIICDVPCSGFGVLAKKPELRYKSPEESASLPKIQSDILENACKYLKVGGTLIYSTCTILPEENEDNVLSFLAKHKEFSLEPWRVGNISADSGMITLLPHVHKTDGFFIAKLKRNF